MPLHRGASVPMRGPGKVRADPVTFELEIAKPVLCVRGAAICEGCQLRQRFVGLALLEKTVDLVEVGKHGRTGLFAPARFPFSPSHQAG